MLRQLKVTVLTVAIFLVVSVNAWAATAVTIEVLENADTPEQKVVTTIDVKVPTRPINAAPLKVGDFVFFEIMHPHTPPLVGVWEGIITNIYETEDGRKGSDPKKGQSD